MPRAKCAGVTVTHEAEQVIVLDFASIQVYYAGTTNPITETIFANDTGPTTKPNPFQSDANGNFAFYLDLESIVKLVITHPDAGVLVADFVPVPAAPGSFVTITGFQTIINKNVGLQDGSPGAPSLNFSSNPTTGMYKEGANSIGWSVGTQKALIILPNRSIVPGGDPGIIAPNAPGPFQYITGVQGIPTGVPTNRTANSQYPVALDVLNKKTYFHNGVSWAPVSIGAADLTNGPSGQVIMAGVSVPTYQPVSRKNRIINGSMRVVQRPGNPSAIDNAYQMVDRWRSITNITAGPAPILQWIGGPGGGSLNANVIVAVGGTGKMGFFHVIESVDSQDLRNYPVSLQFSYFASMGAATDIRAAILQWTSPADAGGISGDPVNTWGGNGAGVSSYLTGWVPANTPTTLVNTSAAGIAKIENITLNGPLNNIGILIWNDNPNIPNGTAMYIVDVQLEKGVVCTEFERTAYALELHNCQRYFYRQQAGGGTNPIAFGQAYSTTQAIVYNKFPVRMRTVPTFSTNSQTDWTLSTAGFSTSGAAALSPYQFTNEVGAINVSIITPIMVAGNATMLMSQSANAYLAYDAEL